MDQGIEMEKGGSVIKKDPLIFQIRELYGRTAYSHKTHEKTADIYHRRLHTLKIVQILLSALTSGSLVLAIMGDDRIGTIVGAVLSTILLIINAYTKNYDLGELVQQHVFTANRLWDIRERYLSILTDLESGDVNTLEARIVRDNILDSSLAILDNAPRTLDAAYKNAQVALKINEELTFTDEEIDNFLPAPLRKTSKPNQTTGEHR